jgi:hypothetical protein
MLTRSLICAAVLGSLVGCAGARPPIQTEAALGKVVVYRNGVAYFERRAVVSDGQLKLTVPVDRVDDFLKSLKVVDAATGRSLPVSFKTVEASHDETEMIISVPGKTARELLVSYVTDSPAWKPSYRVVLGKAPGRAELEAWAVVDNVSGEDWKRVTVGVGSTSALSFRYDLHSVREVERQTLGDDAAVALAPPTGGSPYAVASKEVPIVAVVGGGMVDRLMKNGAVDQKRGVAPSSEEAEVMDEEDKAKPSNGAYKRVRPAAAVLYSSKAMGAGMGAPASAAPSTRDDVALDRLAAQVKKQAGKVKLEGNARSKDGNQNDEALKRANVVRDGLIARGVSPEKLEVAASGVVNDAQAVRVVASAAASGAQQPKAAPGENTKDPIGNAYFVTGVPMTIEKDRSAMVSLVKAEVKAEKAYFYDPVSSRGSNDFAFQAIRIENPTADTLDKGPFTIYAEGQFLGEGLSEPIPPKSAAFIPYALDRQIIVEPKQDGREEIDRLVTIDRGIIDAEARAIKTTKFSLHNRGTEDASVYVRHAVAEGWSLRPTKLPTERLGATYLFKVKVPAHSAVEVSVEEETPTKQTIDLRTPAGIESVGLYVKSATALDPKLREQLDEILKLYREMADAEQKIATLAQQMDEYRARVDEINVQLVTLRKVRTAGELSRHLARKMQEMSDRLQTATIKSTDLKEEVMTRRIRVQDKLAELTLKRDGAGERVAGNRP